jgi:hypothetical protein
MNTELKPCAHCGSISTKHFPGQIVCASCGCGTAKRLTDELALQSWQARAPSDALKEAVEALQSLKPLSGCPFCMDAEMCSYCRTMAEVAGRIEAILATLQPANESEEDWLRRILPALEEAS